MITFVAVERSRRFRSAALVGALVCALALYVSSQAIADVDGTKTADSGTSDASAGGHGTLTVGADFTYSDGDEDLKRVVVDFPAGGVGNPNAVPYADRCTSAQFDTGVCPASSQIGVVKLAATASLAGVPIPLDLEGSISIIQTTPEVPTIVGAYIEPPIGDPIRSYAQFYPVTSGPDGDFRIRSVTSDFPRTAHTDLGDLPIQINTYEQVLWGVLPSGTAFITNPTRCDTWMSYAYVEAWDSNTNADSDPLMTGTNTFKRIEPVPTIPDCSTPNAFNISATASLSTVERGASPTFTTTLAIPNLGALPLAPTTPKAVVATLPDGVNVDIQQLLRVCEVAAFQARACPPHTQVGTVSIKTPMIAAGLRGEVHLVRPTGGRTLPDLGLNVHGAINFTQLGTNRYVGNGTVLQSTFDNIPQVGFSELSLTITGGPGGLLRNDTCPSNGRTPSDSGPITFALLAYQGQAASQSSPVYDFGKCVSYRVTLKRIRRCMRSRYLKVTPRFRDRSNVRFIRVSVRGQKTRTFKRSPFRAKYRLSRKLKRGKTYKYVMRAYFKPIGTKPKGRVVKKV
ncbi:MAG: hypothetical protein ACPGWS_04265, partial [Solirubrobacterales bacterium]